MNMRSVGVAQLRWNLSRYLKRAEGGEHIVVSVRDRPVAILGPLPERIGPLARLVAGGRVAPPAGRGLPDPIALEGDPRALSEALQDLRGAGASSRPAT